MNRVYTGMCRDFTGYSVTPSLTGGCSCCQFLWISNLIIVSNLTASMGLRKCRIVWYKLIYIAYC